MIKEVNSWVTEKGRTSDQRKAMLRDLATSLIVSERIETTEARAKEVRSVVEKLITR